MEMLMETETMRRGIDREKATRERGLLGKIRVVATKRRW